MKLKVRIGLFDEDDAADVIVGDRVVGKLAHVPCEHFAIGTRTFVGRYSLTLTDAAVDAQLYRRSARRVRRGKRSSSRHAGLVAQREWTALGVLALEAAERARAANDVQTEGYYLALARKCDACADQCVSSQVISHDVDPLSVSTSRTGARNYTSKGDDR